MAHRDPPYSIGVLPFCGCFVVERAAQKEIGPYLGWRTGEYDVMSTEEVYVAVAGHRAVCQIQPDLVTRKDA